MKHTIAVALSCMTLLAAPGAAQSVPTVGHAKFHAAVGIGDGSVGVSCDGDGCGRGRVSGPAIMFRAGYGLRPNLVLGGEVAWWVGPTHNSTVGDTLGFASVITQWYPSRTAGFYVKGGCGAGGIQEGTVSVSNFGFQGGVGYDVHLSQNVSVTPYADAIYLIPAGAAGDKSGGNMVHVGLATSWGR